MIASWEKLQNQIGPTFVNISVMVRWQVQNSTKILPVQIIFRRQLNRTFISMFLFTMAGAKQYKKAPIMIANEVAAKLTDSMVFEKVAAVAPGFLNLTLKKEFLAPV